MACDKLCRQKYEGGIGFKNLDDFDTAMLGQKFWLLPERPNSLFAKIFKAQYFRIQALWNQFDNTRHYLAGEVLYQLDLQLAND